MRLSKEAPLNGMVGMWNGFLAEEGICLEASHAGSKVQVRGNFLYK